MGTNEKSKEEEKDGYFSSPSSIVIQRQHLPNGSIVGNRRSYLSTLLKSKPTKNSAKARDNIKRKSSKKSKFDMLLDTVQPLIEVIYYTTKPS